MSILEIKELSKRFGTIDAVKNFNCSIGAGELVGFLGLNGAGKSTTLRIIAGLMLPDSGDVLVKGHSMVSHPRQAKQEIGFVPDRPSLYPQLTAEEYLYFIADLFQLEPVLKVDRAAELLEQFALSDRRHTLISSFSHGMRQRLALCGSLIHDPEILVVDEPLVGLDPRGARSLVETFKKLTAAGKTVLVSTHQLAIAQSACTRVFLLHRGELCYDGPPHDNLEELFFRVTGDAAA